MKARNRKEIFLKALANGEEANIKPLTREEVLLKKQAERESASGGGGTLHWNDIEGKPFGETVETKVISWDGVTDGKEVTNQNGMNYYLIDEAGFIPSDSIMGTVVFMMGDTPQTFEIESVTKTPVSGWYNIYADGQTVAWIDPQKGIYLFAIETPYGYAYVSEISLPTETIQTIDPKYLPSGGGAFVVNMTSNADFTEYAADKSYAEIMNAIEENNIVVQLNDGSSIYHLSYFDKAEDYIVFTNMLYEDGDMFCYQYTIYDDDTVQLDKVNLQLMN